MTTGKIRTFLTGILILVSLGMLNAQNLGDDVLIKEDGQQDTAIVQSPVKQGFNPKVSVSLGSSFSSFAPGVSAFGSYIMPEFTIPVNKKFAVRAGIGYSSVFTNFSGEGSVFNNKPQSYGSVYVEGIYKVSEKVTVSALGYKTFNLQPQAPQETVNPRALDMSNEGVSFNLNYKVNDKFEINAGFSYDKRNYNPYGYGMNPYGTTPFSPANSGFYHPGMRGYNPF
jgi:hypothetical protein